VVHDHHHHHRPISTGAAVAAGVALGTGHLGAALLIGASAADAIDVTATSRKIQTK